MKGNNFHHMVVDGRAFAPQTVASATVEGDAIAEPWKTSARQLVFHINFGTFGGGASGRVRFFQQQRSDDAWVPVLDADGNDLEVDPTVLDAGGAADGTSILCTIPLSDIDGATYKAIRMDVTAESAGTIPVGASYSLFDVSYRPTGQTDYTFYKMFKQPEPA